MRPLPIPDDMVPPWGERQVIAPPDGDLLNEEIAPVEAIVSIDKDQQMVMYTMLIQIEPGDMDSLEATGGKFLLTMGGAVVPFSLGTLTVLPAAEEGEDEDDGSDEA